MQSKIVNAINACGMNVCIKKQYRLLHSENQMDKGNHAVNVSAATINQSNEVTSFIQIVPVSIQSGGNRLNAYVFLDSGSPVSLIDKIVHEKLRAQGTDVTLNIAGIHEGFGERKGSSQIKGTTFKGAFNRSVCTFVNLLGKHKLQLQQAEVKLQPLECFNKQKLQLDGS